MARTKILRKGFSTLADLKDGARSFGIYGATAHNVFYVDALHGNASDSNDGDDPENPLLTIAQGYARCTSNNADVIFIKGGDYRYREDELTIEKDGVRIIGSGWGVEWNRTDSQSGTYVVSVQAKNVVIANMQISVNGANPAVYWGDGGSDNDNAALGLIEGCFIRGNWYSAAGSEGTVGITVDGSSFGPIIRNNYIWGWGTGIDVSDGENRTAYGVHIHDNYITGKTYGIKWSGYGYTSSICNNYIWDWKSSVNMTAAIYLEPSVGGILVAGNYVGAAVFGYDNGDLNYWSGNFVRETEAASEDYSVATIEHDAVTQAD